MEPYTYPYEHVHHAPPERTKLQLEYERMRQLDERRDAELDDWHGRYAEDPIDPWGLYDAEARATSGSTDTALGAPHDDR